jgi:hypothetical protein
LISGKGGAVGDVEHSLFRCRGQARSQICDDQLKVKAIEICRREMNPPRSIQCCHGLAPPGAGDLCDCDRTWHCSVHASSGYAHQSKPVVSKLGARYSRGRAFHSWLPSCAYHRGRDNGVETRRHLVEQATFFEALELDRRLGVDT